MRGRFNKSGASTVSFFAFQDVITGTTGFLIIITIFLALNLDEVISVSHEPDPNKAIAEALQKTLEKVIALKGLVTTAQLAPGETRDTVERMIDDLKRSISRLRSPEEMQAKKNPREESMLDREVRFEIKKLLVQIDLLKKQLPDTTREAAKAESKIASLESEVKDAMDRMQQTIDRKNVLKLIPERSATNKEPMLVVVQKKLLRLQFFDDSPTQMLNTGDDLMAALKACPPVKFYAVLYFKPSGALRFRDLTKLLREAGYEIGYDLISEGTELETGKSRPSRR
jgi:hypothetical protein